MTRLAIATFSRPFRWARSVIWTARDDFYRRTIEAEVRAGSRAEALEYAAAVGPGQRGLSPEEVKERIIRRYRSSTTERGR